MTPQDFFRKHVDLDPLHLPIHENCLLDMACPSCGGRLMFRIWATIQNIVGDDGTEPVDGNVEYDDNNSCQCGSCQYVARVAEFIVPGLDNYLDDLAIEHRKQKRKAKYDKRKKKKS
jgi:hypothetical protein